MKSVDKKPSNNELGEYLPDGDAELSVQSEPIQARNRNEAEKKCDEIAAEYGGIEPQVEKDSIHVFQWDCKFKLWS